jgi:hypothetical protein
MFILSRLSSRWVATLVMEVLRAVMWIRIRIRIKFKGKIPIPIRIRIKAGSGSVSKLDPGPHQNDKLDPYPHYLQMTSHNVWNI